MTGPFDREAAMAGLTRALPYIRLYKGRAFVIKLGGSLSTEGAALRQMAEQINVLREVGIRVVLVHGGGPQTTALAGRLGVETRFVNGRRVTPPAALEAAVMTLNGTVNTAILAACRAVHLPAIGVSGVDAGLLLARLRPPVEVEGEKGKVEVDFGEVGDLVDVDRTVLERLLGGGFVPVVSPISADEGGRVLNVNADTAAATIACALDAAKLIFLTDTPGILEQRPVGDNLIASIDLAPLECINSHLDTVPASPAWTRPPHEPAVVDGRVFGLGSNDAKAAAAAMTAAFLRLAAERERLDVRVLLALAAEEEVGSRGSEALVPELVRQGLKPEVVLVGEPTGLDVATAQKGLLVLELVGSGDACHAAHGRALGAANAIRSLARDLVALEGVNLGPPHPRLGPVTVEPTMVSGGTARNMVPARASCILDVRTNPEPGPDEVVERLRAGLAGELRVVSKRLRPYEIADDHPLVKAALSARPGAKTFASRGLSDLVFFTGIPGVKVGPGDSERSHTPDEYVLEREVVEGARFYEAAVRACREVLVAGRAA